ncbi:DUF6047 family protein [Bacteroides eggerthii]|uniref:DUF6047 family protein n=1 Tax=Bacteroides eggerthii TaxID=28111 RepID=UPI0022E26632|nr:DUF6047 family protein [Bacteroides eggerthii]
MSILNDIWNRIAGKSDKRKATAADAPGMENRVYAVATEEGVMLFSDTPKGMKARNSYLQHLADGFFNMAKVPETLRIYELELPTKRVAELADNCIEKLSKTDLRSTDGQLRKSVVSFTPDKFADRSVLDGGVCKEKFDLRPDFHNFDRLTKEFGLGISPRNYNVAALLYISENGYAGLVAADKVHPFSYEYEFKELAEKLGESMKARMNAPLSAHDFGYAALQKEAREMAADLLQSEFHITDGEFRLGARISRTERMEKSHLMSRPHSEEVKTGKSPETYRRQETPGQKPSDRQRQARHVAPIVPQKKEKKQLIL